MHQRMHILYSEGVHVGVKVQGGGRLNQSLSPPPVPLMFPHDLTGILMQDAL